MEVKQIIDWKLHLYLPAASVSRTAMAPDKPCEHKVRKGDTVIILIYPLHRNDILGISPDTLKPERFATTKIIPRYAHMPFCDRPCICIGTSFAIEEAVISLAKLLKQLHFRRS